MEEATVEEATMEEATKVHLDVPQCHWQNIMWTDEITVELVGRNTQHYVWRKKGTAHQYQNLIPTIKHHSLGLLCHLRAWTDCHHRRKNDFPSLSRHFAGEC
jgi:hypothetical protein